MKDALSNYDLERPLRVLLSSYRSHPHVGGQGIYVRQLARALKNAGCEVTVVSGPPYPELDHTIGLEKLPSLNLFETDNAFMAFRPEMLKSKADMTEWLAHNTGAFAEMTSYALRLENFIKKNAQRFDVIHDNQTLAMPMARISNRVPVVTTLHHPIAIDRDFAVKHASSWWRAALASRWHSFIKVQARAIKKLPYFLAVSQTAKHQYQNVCGLDPSRVEVGLNGIDHNSFKAQSDIIRTHDHILALASADVPIKGLDILIEALSLLKRDKITPKLTVIGRLREGPTQTLLKRENLSEQVQFVSDLSDEALASLYRQCSVFVSPSRFEGFGFPPAEAMACGAPVIVSSGGALPEVVGDAGIITPVEDSQALASALKTVLSDRDMRQSMSKKSIARARSAFRWDNHAQMAIKLYNRALTERAKPGALLP